MIRFLMLSMHQVLLLTIIGSSLLLQLTNALSPVAVRHRLTTTCTVHVPNENGKKQDYRKCSKKSVNKYLNNYSPDPEWRFNDVDGLTLLSHSTTIVMIAIENLNPHGGGVTLGYTANSFEEQPIPDYFRRKLGEQTTSTTAATAVEQPQQESQLDHRFLNEDIFRNEFQNRLYNCLVERNFFDGNPPKKKKVTCSGTYTQT